MTDLAENGDEHREEVRKLQNLVEKLEKQNEILRQKADKNVNLSVNASKGTGLMLHEPHTTHLHSGENGSEDNADIKSVHDNSRIRKNSRIVGDGDMELHSGAGDEDSWLYTSPLKAPTPDQKSVSPYDWIRQDFENPNGSMDSARISLLAKLEEVSRANRNSQILSKPQPIPEVDVVQPGGGACSCDAVIDDFSGSKQFKSHRSNEENEPPDSASSRSPEKKSSQDERLFKKLEDVTDVQILAKMQEESLRQALHRISPGTSPNTTPRGQPGGSPASPERSLSSRTSSLGSSEGGIDDSLDNIPVVSGVMRRRPRTAPGHSATNGTLVDGRSDEQVPVVTGVVRRRGKTPTNQGSPERVVDSHEDDQIPLVSGVVKRRGKAPVNQGSPERVLEERGGDDEKIPVVSGVVRRRPSFERAKKEDFRRHSYGAKLSMGSDLNNGDHLQASDLQRLVLEDFRRHSYGAKLSMGSDLNNGDHLQASDLQRLVLVSPSAEQPAGPKANLGRTYGAKRVESEPPPPPPPTPCTDAEPRLKQSSAANHVAGNKGSSLRQPSPVTAGRIPTPKRSIPTRQIPTPKTGIPRPRSAAPPKSQLPTPGSKSAIPGRRPSPQFKPDEWKDGCY